MGGGDGGFRVLKVPSAVRCGAVIGFFIWSWISTPLEYYSVSHVFRVKFYVKVAFTKKQSKVVRRVWAYFSQRDSLLSSERTLLNGDRGEGGGGYSLKRSEKLFSRLYFWDSTITHMQIFHSRVNIIINFSSTLFFKYSFCQSACKAEKTIYR